MGEGDTQLGVIKFVRVFLKGNKHNVKVVNGDVA
jgi:hypothetical protein